MLVDIDKTFRTSKVSILERRQVLEGFFFKVIRVVTVEAMHYGAHGLEFREKSGWAKWFRFICLRLNQRLAAKVFALAKERNLASDLQDRPDRHAAILAYVEVLTNLLVD